VSPGASAAFQWGSVPAVGPPPLAIVASVGLLSVALFVALVLIDALAARERREQAASRADARPDAEPAEAEPAVGLVLPDPPTLPDLPAAQQSQLALARLRRFAAVAAEPAVEADGDRRWLAHWAVFSAYRDCAALGLEVEARAVLRAAGVGSPTESEPRSHPIG